MSSPYQFHFDFLSPNAYLAHRVIPQLEAQNAITFDYVPVSILGQFQETNNKPTPVQLHGVKNKPAYVALEMKRFCERHGIIYNLPQPFPFNSMPYLAGAIAAERAGVGRAYIEAVFTAAYEDVLDMTKADMMARILEKAGLPADPILAAQNDTAIAAELASNLKDSVARGTFGSPTFFIGAEMFFGKDRLELIQEAIDARQAA